MMKTIQKADVPFDAAGRIWLVPRADFVELPDGELAMTEVEIARIHRAIANEICGHRGILSFAELEFLCDLTDTRLVDVARKLDIHKSTLSKWRHQGHVSRLIISAFLKRHFWFKLFGADLAETTATLERFSDDEEFLEFARDQAVLHRLTEHLRPVAA